MTLDADTTNRGPTIKNILCQVLVHSLILAALVCSIYLPYSLSKCITSLEECSNHTTIIANIVTLIGIISVFTAYYTFKSNEEEKRNRDLVRLTAWWVSGVKKGIPSTDKTVDPDGWNRDEGIVISNTSETLFFNIEIYYKSKYTFHRKPYRQDEIQRIKEYVEGYFYIRFLPPGKYFIRHPNHTAVMPRPLEEPFFPIFINNKYDIYCIDYTDAIGKRWRWQPSTGISELNQIYKERTETDIAELINKLETKN
ncbi:hypothetical protein [Stomatohabitans albus]|uniref:hypothetical protein n=1 Tax=Stomatohabitans albus TaxID=3110766 RepID=UPI00300C9EF4